MKIYVVTGGEYSAYKIFEVFLSEEKAKLYTAVHPVTDIEIYDTFDDNIEGEAKIKKVYHITIYGDGVKYRAEIKEVKFISTIQEYKYKYAENLDFNGDFDNYYGIFSIDVDTEDKNKAIKIAYDKRMELLAKRFGFDILPTKENSNEISDKTK